MKAEDQAVQAYQKVLQIYGECGLNEEGSPDLYWKVHDYLGDAVSDLKVERQHYMKAIEILTNNMTTAPEVCVNVKEHCLSNKSYTNQPS